MKTRVLWRKFAWISLQKEKEEIAKAYLTVESAEPELCIKLIQHSSVHNFLGLQKKIQSSDEKWIKVSLNLLKHAKSQAFNNNNSNLL